MIVVGADLKHGSESAPYSDLGPMLRLKNLSRDPELYHHGMTVMTQTVQRYK